MMIYLDNAATSFPKPEAVLRACREASMLALGNPGRSVHRASRTAERIVADARSALHRLLGGVGPECFHFAGSGSAAVEWCLKLVVRPGCHVVTGNLEHRAVLAPLRSWQQQGLIRVSSVTCNEAGYYQTHDVANAIDRDTCVVALAHASNVLGTIQPIAALARVCRAAGVPLLLDAAQTVGIVPVHIGELGADLLAAPGHKGLLGPMGVGFFYASPEIECKSLSPWLRDEEFGGLDAAIGTHNVIGLAGLSAGIGYLLGRGLEEVWDRELQLGHMLDDELASVPEVQPMPTMAADGPRLSLRAIQLAGWAPHAAAVVLDAEDGIAVRSGFHCAPEVHRWLGMSPGGTLRVSPGLFTTEDDVHRLGAALRELGASALGGEANGMVSARAGAT